MLTTRELENGTVLVFDAGALVAAYADLAAAEDAISAYEGK